MPYIFLDYPFQETWMKLFPFRVYFGGTAINAMMRK